MKEWKMRGPPSLPNGDVDYGIMVVSRGRKEREKGRKDGMGKRREGRIKRRREKVTTSVGSPKERMSHVDIIREVPDHANGDHFWPLHTYGFKRSSIKETGNYSP